MAARYCIGGTATNRLPRRRKLRVPQVTSRDRAVLEFGDQAWSIRRQEFHGAGAGLTAALQTACRAAIAEARPQGDAPDAVERDLLKRLAGESPVAEEQGQWRLYQWGAGHTILIGTRATPDFMAKAAHDSGTKLDKTPFRVVIWGVAIPADKDAWNLYLFQSKSGEAGQGGSEIPLPPGGHRLIAIRAAGGESITAFFTDDGDPAKAFYDRWFAEHDWKFCESGGWQRFATGWHARFESRFHQSADVHLGADSQGRWSGLVMQSPLERGKL